jgi:hypothetical protein
MKCKSCSPEKYKHARSFCQTGHVNHISQLQTLQQVKSEIYKIKAIKIQTISIHTEIYMYKIHVNCQNGKLTNIKI